MVGDVADLVGEEVELAAEGLDFGFGATVDVEVQLAAQAVLFVLAVLLIMMTGAWMAASIDRKRLSRMNG